MLNLEANLRAGGSVRLGFRGNLDKKPTCWDSLPLLLLWKSSWKDYRALGSHAHSCTQGCRAIGLAAPTESQYWSEGGLVQPQKGVLLAEERLRAGKANMTFPPQLPPPLHNWAWWPHPNSCQWPESWHVLLMCPVLQTFRFITVQADSLEWDTSPAEIQVSTEKSINNIIFWTKVLSHIPKERRFYF